MDICFGHLCLYGLVVFVFLISWCRVLREWMDALKRALCLMQQVSFLGVSRARKRCEHWDWLRAAMSAFFVCGNAGI